jgi:hypothetical protein
MAENVQDGFIDGTLILFIYLFLAVTCNICRIEIGLRLRRLDDGTSHDTFRGVGPLCSLASDNITGTSDVVLR